MYDCQSIGCKNLTKNYFCDECLAKINNINFQIILCENCYSTKLVFNPSITLKKREKYQLIKECEKCGEKHEIS